MEAFLNLATNTLAGDDVKEASLDVGGDDSDRVGLQTCANLIFLWDNLQYFVSFGMGVMMVAVICVLGSFGL